MVFGIHYCENCENEFDDLDIGYGEYSGECKRWQCRLLNWIYICVLLALTGFIILIIPVIEFFEWLFGGKNGSRN